jgi:hypothetical protein
MSRDVDIAAKEALTKAGKHGEPSFGPDSKNESTSNNRDKDAKDKNGPLQKTNPDFGQTLQ